LTNPQKCSILLSQQNKKAVATAEEKKMKKTKKTTNTPKDTPKDTPKGITSIDDKIYIIPCGG